MTLTAGLPVTDVHVQPDGYGLPASVLAQVPWGVALLDEQLRYRWVNDMLAHYNGLPADEHVGRTVHQVVPQVAEALVPLLERVLRTGEAVIGVEVASGPVAPGGGGSRLWRVSYLPTAIDAATPRGLVVFADDITDQREMELDRLQAAFLTERFAAFAAAIAAAMSVDDVADAVHDLAGVALSVSACGVALCDDGDKLTFAGRAAAHGQGRWTPVPTDADLPLAHVMRTGESLFIPDPSALTERWPELRGLQEATGDQAWAALALSGGDDVLGVLAFAFPQVRPFSAEDRQYLLSIAGLTSQALQRALAHQRERSIATTLQRALLPGRLPAIAGLQIASRYRAASNTADVGGDFYDVFTLDDEQTVHAVIGDVCHGGLPAAAMVGKARYALRALVRDHAPAAALRSLNSLLRHDDPSGPFLTAACLRIQLNPTPVVTIANGGHPAPLAVTADRTVREVGDYGTVLGAFAEVTLRERTETLEPGSALVLYTDGVIEARGHNGQYGERRLHRLLQDSPVLAAEALAERIMDDVDAFTTHPRDDIAILVLTFDP